MRLLSFYQIPPLLASIPVLSRGIHRSLPRHTPFPSTAYTPAPRRHTEIFLKNPFDKFENQTYNMGKRVAELRKSSFRLRVIFLES